METKDSDDIRINPIGALLVIPIGVVLVFGTCSGFGVGFYLEGLKEGNLLEQYAAIALGITTAALYIFGFIGMFTTGYINFCIARSDKLDRDL